MHLYGTLRGEGDRFIVRRGLGRSEVCNAGNEVRSRNHPTSDAPESHR
jgi:hypothetical protein